MDTEKTPKPNSYAGLVLKQLESGAKVTTDSIYQDFHTHDGRKILSELRLEFNQPIKSMALPANNGKKPRNIYWLDQSNSQQLSA